MGQGGFGITYLAKQTALDRHVRIKEFFMKAYCMRNETTMHVPTINGGREAIECFRHKFLREARIIFDFNHPPTSPATTPS